MRRSNRWRVGRQLAGLIGLSWLASACSMGPSLGEERLAMRCIVQVSAEVNGETSNIGASERLIWLDPANGRYAISELGESGVDQDWAQHLQNERADNEGLALIQGGAGAFACFARAEAGACIHGVDLEKARYVFASPFSAGGPEGVRSGVLRGDGECNADVNALSAWPRPTT